MNTALLSLVAPLAIAIAILFFVLGQLKDPWRARLQSLVLLVGFCWGIGFHGDTAIAGKFAGGMAYAAALMVIFVWLSPKSHGSRYLLRAIFVVAAGGLVLWPMRAQLQGSVHLRNLLAFFFLGLGTWSITERCSQSLKTLSLLTLPLLTIVTLSLYLYVLGSAQSQSLVYLVRLLAALLAGVWAVTLVAPGRVSAASFMPFVSVFVVLFLATTHFYLQINPWIMIYLCLPFLVMWIRNWIPLVPHEPRSEALVLALIALVPLVYFVWNIPHGVRQF